MDLKHMNRIIILVFGISLTVSANENSQLYVPCRPGWYFFGEKCYKVLGSNEKLSWREAKVRCSLEGGYLASILSQEMQDFITTFLLMTAKTNPWIGLHDLMNETNFSWDDGSILNYTNWDTHRPFSAIRSRDSYRPYSRILKHQSVIGDEVKTTPLPNNEFDCVQTRYSGHGSKMGAWADMQCDFHLSSYLCQVNKSVYTKSPDPRFCSIEDGGGWKYFDSCYHIVKEEKSWEDAEKYCEEKFKGFLVTISNWEYEKFIHYIHTTNLLKDVWIGIKLQNTTTQMWATRRLIYSVPWRQKPLYFENGSCVLKSKEYSWANSPCHNKYPFICEKSNIPVPQRFPSNEWKCPNSSGKWLNLEGDSCYYIEYEKLKTWLEARDECGKIGGTLASFHSEEETNVLNSHFMDRNKFLFIGLIRVYEHNNVFEWEDGTEFNYQYWLGRKPNVQYGGRSIDEGCVNVWTESMKWQVVPCNSTRGYICKSKKVFSKREELSTSCPCTFAASKEQSSSGGISAGTVVGIVFCTLLVFLLVGFIAYYFRYFWKRSYVKANNGGFTSFKPGSISEEVIWKLVN